MAQSTEFLMDHPGRIDIARKCYFNADHILVEVEPGFEVVGPALNADYGVIVEFDGDVVYVDVYEDGEDCGTIRVHDGADLSIRPF